MSPTELEEGRKRISDRLRTARKELNISQAALAERSGLNVRTIRRMENGREGAWDIDSQIIYETALNQLTVL